MRSKNPTPVTSALPRKVTTFVPGSPPHAATIASRACFISARAFALAPIVQVWAGNSAIMLPPILGSARTRWMSESFSRIIDISSAFTR
jgi:hypothetical protein